MHPKQAFSEKCDLNIRPWPWQMTLTLVAADVYLWDVSSYKVCALQLK